MSLLHRCIIGLAKGDQMNEKDVQVIENYIENMSKGERDAFRFGLTYMVSELSAYVHQLIDEGKDVTHDMLTSMEHHYLRDLAPDKFDETLKTILMK
jgi:hypothetical protein